MEIRPVSVAVPAGLAFAAGQVGGYRPLTCYERYLDRR